jgi:hypothetical protein
MVSTVRIEFGYNQTWLCFRVRLDMLALCMQVSVSALADFECSKIMLFADRVLAGTTRNLPPEATVTVIA